MKQSRRRSSGGRSWNRADVAGYIDLADKFVGLMQKLTPFIALVGGPIFVGSNFIGDSGNSNFRVANWELPQKMLVFVVLVALYGIGFGTLINTYSRSRDERALLLGCYLVAIFWALLLILTAHNLSGGENSNNAAFVAPLFTVIGIMFSAWLAAFQLRAGKYRVSPRVSSNRSKALLCFSVTASAGFTLTILLTLKGD